MAVVAWFTGLDAASNEPEYRQADWFAWLLLAVSLSALVWRRRWGRCPLRWCGGGVRGLGAAGEACADLLALLAYGVNLRSRAGADARDLDRTVTAALASLGGPTAP
ncbi:hypothetical protein ABT063_03120 [Streptomyces sp. NPDC002838]|uniref:hypothetical protein n=1 Tax=Streptomyces sp. NPDC002838 TaxID=3154436 RepID=UPI003331F119